MLPIHQVDRRRAEAVEPLGTKRKFWFTENDRRILFKAEERGTGEDWAEVIACHLCELLCLPHVHYELAEEWDGNTYVQPGVVCETCAPAPISLILGNQLLLERDPAYPAEERKYRVPEHTVGAVADVVRRLAMPAHQWMKGVPSSIGSALEVFVGYILLDAWIANQDRHHENWAALRQGEELRLAPTYDHGASLARNISDTERKDRLGTKDQRRTVGHFAGRARSALYGDRNDAKPLGTLEAFLAFARLAPAAARVWLDNLAGITAEAIQAILAEVPPKRMSKIAKTFTLELLVQNQQRILREKVG